MIDKFYTPADLCSLAYRSCGYRSTSISIGDFCCGSGSLLELAPFQEKNVFGLDIDSEIIHSLRTRHPNWKLVVGDFLAPEKYVLSELMDLKGTLDLVVLNPPFSYRGGSVQEVYYKGQKFKCSKPMAFIAKSTEYLKPTGSMMAILPKSVIRTEKDAALLSELRMDWEIRIQDEYSRNAFEGCFPRSILVTFEHRDRRQSVDIMLEDAVSRRSIYNSRIHLIRGTIPVYRTSLSAKHPVLHTTNLRDDDILGSIRCYSERTGRQISGDVIVLPRVGSPDLRKVRTISIDGVLSLSDCVIGLQCEDSAKQQELYDKIVSRWESLETMYQSTCAPYITVKQLSKYLNDLGVDVKYTNAYQTEGMKL